MTLRHASEPAAAGTFESGRFESAYPPGIESHYWTRARNRIVADQLRRIASPGARVVEVGCGKGIVVEHLRRAGWDAKGLELAPVDPLPSVRDHVTTNRDAREPPPDLAASADALLFLDVVEHLDDPDWFLADAVRAFPRASALIVTAPARAELWSNYDQFYGHRRRYDILSLRSLLDPLGGAIVDLRYFFRLLYVPARLLGAVGRPRPVEIPAPSRALRPLHAAIAAIAYLEYRLLPRRIRGTSVLAAVRMSARDGR